MPEDIEGFDTAVVELKMSVDKLDFPGQSASKINVTLNADSWDTHGESFSLHHDLSSLTNTMDAALLELANKVSEKSPKLIVQRLMERDSIMQKYWTLMSNPDW